MQGTQAMKTIKSTGVTARYEPRPRGIETWGGSTRIRRYFRLSLWRFYTAPKPLEKLHNATIFIASDAYEIIFIRDHVTRALT